MLRIQADKLVTAMLNDRIEDVYYLDLETGDVVIIREDDGTGVTEDGLTFGIDYNPELRFMFIEPLLAEERRWMIEHFIESLPESVLKYRLGNELLAGLGIEFSRYPRLIKPWEVFLEREIIDIYSRWLKQIGVEAKIIPSGEIKGPVPELVECPEEVAGWVM